MNDEKNLENLEKNKEISPFLSQNSEFLKKYKESDDPIKDTLRFNTNPSTKLILITMLVYRLSSYTTSELNSYLCRNYTYDNICVALKEYIDNKSVVIVNKKVGARYRKSFSIDYDKFINITEE